MHDCPGHLPEFQIALHTGMRRSEQFKATWENVNFFTGKLRIPKAKHGEVRLVKLNSRVKAQLQMIKPTPARRCIHHIQSPGYWFEEGGISNSTWHCLRHTYLSRLVMNGVDILHHLQAGWSQVNPDDHALCASGPKHSG